MCRCKVEITCLWQEGNGSQLQGLEDVEQASHYLRVVAGHGGIPQGAHESIDGHRGVVLLTAGHQARRVQQVPSQVILWNGTYSQRVYTLSQWPSGTVKFSSCEALINQRNRLWLALLTNGADRRAAGAVILPLGPHALALQLALPLEVRLVRLVRMRVQCSDDAKNL
jgi:hypothetical protein